MRPSLGAAVTLLVAPCSAAAARYAVEHWHYSHRIPASISAYYGVWSDDAFIGTIVWSWGGNPKAWQAYGLTMYEAVELVRVALRHDHTMPVSQVVARAVRRLHDDSPGLRLLTSYADPYNGHHGGIYQAMNWIYLGPTSHTHHWELPSGRVVHNRTLTGVQFGQPKPRLPFGAVRVTRPPKHKYAWPLDRAMRRQIAPLARPYPRGRGLDGEPPEPRSGSASSTLADRSHA